MGNFIQFEATGRPSDCITVSKTAISLNRHFGRLLKDRRVNILIDKEDNLLWLQPDESGTNLIKLDSKRDYYFISTVVSREIKQGWYQYQKPSQDTNGYIFKFLRATPTTTNQKEGV